MENTFLLKWDAGVFKADRKRPFASNKRLIDNHILILDMLYSYMSVVCTYHCRGVFKKVFFTQGNLQGGRVKEHRMMFNWHLYLLQSQVTGHFAQKTFRTSLLAQVLDRSHNSQWSFRTIIISEKHQCKRYTDKTFHLHKIQRREHRHLFT